MSIKRDDDLRLLIPYEGSRPSCYLGILLKIMKSICTMRYQNKYSTKNMLKPSEC